MKLGDLRKINEITKIKIFSGVLKVINNVTD